MSSGIRWQNNSLVSLELRDGSFVLLQMLDSKGWIAVLNCYRDKNEWDDVNLNENDVLFVTCALRNFLKRSNLNRVKDVEIIKGLSSPNTPQTRLNTKPHYRNITLWSNTEDEVTVLASGGNGDVGLHTTGRDCDGTLVDDFKTIEPSEYHQFERMETSHLSDYGTLNERLLLCKNKGWNFDPMRNLIFDWSLDRECSIYAKLISGKVRFDELGYYG